MGFAKSFARRDMKTLPKLTVRTAIIASLLMPLGAFAAEGLYGPGGGSRGASMGGAEVASPDDALSSMAENPAGLSFLTAPEFDSGLLGASAYGRFYSDKTGSGGTASTNPVIGPEGAIAAHLPHTPLSFGIGVIPEIGLESHWSYRDPLGGLGGTTSYGQQNDASAIDVLRLDAGMSIALTSKLSIGGAVGFDYNENRLQTPYIFQSQPVLAGFKTLLNLSTSGWGANGSAGILYRPTDTVAIAFSYQSRTIVKTYGEATGNASAQLKALGPGFAGVQRTFHYDAEVDNTFPQIASGGVAWKFHPGWEADAQVDWTSWADAFDSLPVKLSNGNNAQVNGLVGSNSMQDNIPLEWKNTWTERVGLEYDLTKSIALRAGYSYGKSPVPSGTLTPMTAILPQNTLTAGVGYTWRFLECDLAYGWDIPVTRHVDNSQLLDGEYSDSSVRTGIQWLSFTTSVKF
jgi:long-chain fatty acid transport protein